MCGVAIDVVLFNDTASTEIDTLSLHDALPILARMVAKKAKARKRDEAQGALDLRAAGESNEDDPVDVGEEAMDEPLVDDEE